jgi:hypothetical protein
MIPEKQKANHKAAHTDHEAGHDANKKCFHGSKNSRFPSKGSNLSGVREAGA